MSTKQTLCLNTLYLFFHWLKKRLHCRYKSENAACWLSHVWLLGCYRPNWFWTWFYKQYIINTQEHFGEKLVEVKKLVPSKFPCYVLFSCCLFSDPNYLEILPYIWLENISLFPWNKNFKDPSSPRDATTSFCITEDKTEHFSPFVSANKVCNDIVLCTTRQFIHNNGTAHLEFNCGS